VKMNASWLKIDDQKAHLRVLEVKLSQKQAI
jgi:hypothetical protein